MESRNDNSVFRKIYSFIYSFRLGIGLLFSFPFMMYGLFIELALLGWDFSDLSIFRLIFATLISLLFLIYVWGINDFYDAPFDSLDPIKRSRNYFCSDHFENNPLKGYLVLIIPLGSSLVCSLLLGFEIFLIFFIVLIIGHFYSAPPLRFKEKPFFDFVTHGFYVGGFFFFLGGSIVSTTSVLLIQPLFLLLFNLSVIDGAWIQFNSQIFDFEIDEAGDQSTTSLFLGKKKSLWILRILLFLMLSTLPQYFLLNSYLQNKLSNFIINTIILGGLFLVVIYFIMTNGGINKFTIIVKRSAKFRICFIYPFAVLSILLL
ncbi:MAG: UbiA family prenyltransferase [Candidatus Hodarchaeales archaeon]